MKRTVDVARTAHNLSHVNRLVVPSFAVKRLALVMGGKASKSHQPKGAPPPTKANSGTDDFHFAPEKENIEIQYEIDDKFGVVEGAKLEWFSRFDDKPVATIDLKPLGPTWWTHGEHVIKWDGRLVKPTAEQKATVSGDVSKHDFTSLPPDKSDAARFPDGFVTLEFTPYKLKMTLVGAEGMSRGEVAWTYWHILIKSLEIEIGAEAMIPAATVNDARHKQDKAVRAKVAADGGVPGSGSTRKVILLSNVYKTSLGQMDTDAGHTAYQGLWSDGPNIPIVAKVRLLDSADGEVKLESDKGAVALGHVKFLWDWEDPDEAVSAQVPPAKPKGFITNAIKRYKDGTDSTRAAKNHTYPKGDNCHVDHGGKRGPDAHAVFPAQPGYAPQAALKTGAFPFPVKVCDKRKWAALSEGWTSGAGKGMTGVIFQPSRMGGDDYTLSVYLAYDRSSKTDLVLDAKTEPLAAPAAIKSKTMGTFQMWREVHVARYIRKKSTMTAFLPGTALPSIQAHLQMPYIDLVNKMGATNSYVLSDHKKKDGTVPNYNTLLKARLTATAHVFVTFSLMVDAAFDHAAVDSMMKVRNYADFVRTTHAALNPAVAGVGADFTTAGVLPDQLGITNLAPLAAGAVKTRLTATKNWLVSWTAQNRNGYLKGVDDIGFGIGEPFANDLELIKGGKSGEAPHGVTTMHFNFTNTFLRDLFAAGVGVGYWYGAAIDPADADINRCVIMFWFAGVDEFSHEYGHHLFLPHAKYPVASPPSGHKDDRHDDTDSGCLMSYSSARPAYCGLCQLRLRGWSALKLSKTSANNTKP